MPLEEKVLTVNQPKVSYYAWMAAHDLLEQLRPLWESGGFYLREADGRLTGSPRMAIDTPWRHVKTQWGFDCATWHRIVFDYLSKRLPAGERFVPSKCQECFKVVVRPRSVKELFALENLQLRLNLPSKCGLEIRGSVPALYGGYFYNQGLAAGLNCYREVRRAVNEDKHLGPDVGIILKRGCTEFEMECGPSDKWRISEVQLKFEALVDRYVVRDDVIREQPEHLVWHIHRKWIEFAYAHGDLSYLEFTDNQPLYPPVVTYHHLAEQQPSVPETGSPEKAEVGK